MASKQYEPMKPEDSIVKTSYDKAIGKDQTAITFLRFKTKRRFWWWPFRSKRQKQLEVLTNHVMNQEDVIQRTMQKLTNLYLYGDENGKAQK